jgi:hypothetical protein
LAVHRVEQDHTEPANERTFGAACRQELLLAQQRVGCVTNHIPLVVAAYEQVGAIFHVGQVKPGPEAQIHVGGLVLAFEHTQAQAAVADLAAVGKRPLAKPAVHTARQPFRRRARRMAGGFQHLLRLDRLQHGRGPLCRRGHGGRLHHGHSSRSGAGRPGRQSRRLGRGQPRHAVHRRHRTATQGQRKQRQQGLQPQPGHV